MSFVKNDTQQLSFNDPLYGLTEREKRILDKSWATTFADRIFPLIKEERFACLYSDKASRPNTPVNVIVGALILKELRGQTDDELLESLLFDVRYQRALHTDGFEEQPMSDATLKRFRRRCLTYETEHGVDLIGDCVKDLSGEMAKLMKINGQIRRMDSLMVASNIKRLSHMELLYTCLSNFVTYLHKTEGNDKLSGLEHYYDPNDMNAVIYHKSDVPASESTQTILNDISALLEKCEGSYDDVDHYQLLIRVVNEQTVRNEETTDLKGRDTPDIYADFVFASDGGSIIKCPAGYTPVSSSKVKSTGSCRSSFDRKHCETCPYRDQCRPKFGNKKAVVYVSQKSSERAKARREMSTTGFKIIARVRNGVETIPSILRRRYHVDHMPVRGLIRMKQWFGFKIAALNFRKLSRYLDSLGSCTQMAAIE